MLSLLKIDNKKMMLSKKVWIGTGITVFLILIAISILLSGNKITQDKKDMIKEAEVSFIKSGITTNIEYYPRYESLQIQYYYKDKYCSQIIENVVSDISDEKIGLELKKVNTLSNGLLTQHNLLSEEDTSLPLIILKGRAKLYDNNGQIINTLESYKTIIYGVSACSYKVISSTLCEYLGKEDGVCQENRFVARNKKDKAYIPTSNACNEACNIEVISGGNIIRKYFQGFPCKTIESYNPGLSTEIYKQCYKKNSCKTDEEDKGCCNIDDCVSDGRCYEKYSTTDTDNDGQKEVCIVSSSETSWWVNPDMQEDVCLTNFEWFSCQDKEECRHGIDNYDSKNNGMCCGDDKGEKAIKCKGILCEEILTYGLEEKSLEDISCCKEDECVYDKKCYKQGCNKVRLLSGEKVLAYCNETVWIDLDSSYCPECLGQDAWSGLVCCGDDHNEGKYPQKFLYNSPNEKSNIEYHSCTDNKNNCVFPGEDTDFVQGCYKFDKEKYLKGRYFCEDGEWYDLDNGSVYCSACGFGFIDGVCCGDDKNEHHIFGKDGTNACCPYESDIVMKGTCYHSAVCGDRVINQGEECELPETPDNKYCLQPEIECKDLKTGVRDSLGYCNSECRCESDELDYRCIKGSCGASCSNDIDCGIGFKCNLSSCRCIEKDYCGDGAVQGINDDGVSEKCEYPDTILNPYCQNKKECYNKKTSVRYENGRCDKECGCIYETSQNICIKGSCSAECNEDGSGCAEGYVCDINECGCIRSEKDCGDRICEEGEQNYCPEDCYKESCPYRIDIEFDKNSYYTSDFMEIAVSIFDRNNKIMPNENFDLEIYMDNSYIKTESEITPSSGYYERSTKPRKVSYYQNSGYMTYIAKTRKEGCEIIGDSEGAVVFRNKTKIYDKKVINLSSSVSIDYSMTELILENTLGIVDEYIYMGNYLVGTTNDDFIKFIGKQNKSSSGNCGNNVVELGEVCEGTGICRASEGCNYIGRYYDVAEYCNSCDCPNNLRTAPDSELYCINCEEHCGDSYINCGEECEEGTKSYGNYCRTGMLYNRTDTCVECSYEDDGIKNDILLSECYCECPESPDDCVDGDYIEYRQSYHAGCYQGECVRCDCSDIYTKDSNNDGIEDKCSEEICNNKIDDNDDKLIDMDDPGCSICSNCGIGIFNICDHDECSGLLEGCYFTESLYGLGRCNSCKDMICENYIDNENCIENQCKLTGCIWKSGECCTDTDNDEVCDGEDNCKEVYNPMQVDSDNDSRGDKCETCIYEPKLYEPKEDNESICNDGIDNDCDNHTDCYDKDCRGIDECCFFVSDCSQDECVIEKCKDNICEYDNREVCDNTECAKDYYCDKEGKCRDSEDSKDVCLLCSTDTTPEDLGMGFGQEIYFEKKSISMKGCCGNDIDEYYLTGTGNYACCDDINDKVDEKGICSDE